MNMLQQMVKHSAVRASLGFVAVFLVSVDAKSAVFSSAGGTGSGAGYTFRHTFGEAIVGASSGGGFRQATGFWEVDTGEDSGNQQGILREWFLGIPGDTLASLTNDPTFPDAPSGSSIEPLFEGPLNFGNDYGTRLRGYVLPPVTGSYTFWIAGDDSTELYLSTDELPAHKTVIAGSGAWSNYREWDRDPAQRSVEIPLVAGRRYYIEALHKEGSGDDHISVGWQLPDGTLERPIPGNRLNPWVNESLPDLQLTSSVSPILVTENIARDLTVTVSNIGPATANGVQLTGNAPLGLRILSATNSAGSCQLQGNSNVICSVASLNSNSAFTVILTVRANFLPPEADEFMDWSDWIWFTSSSESDFHLADNSLSLPVRVHAQTDWGDARGGFPVTVAENGARHRYSPTAPWLGVRWDNDEIGNHSPNADFDDTHGAAPDDEDGVVFTSPLVPGASASVIVICKNAPGFLDGWADFYGNTNWSDAGEQIFTGVPLAVGSNTLSFSVPADAVAGTTTTRWRVSTNGLIMYNGHAGFGEVEDHTNVIQAPLPVDVAVNLQGLSPEPDLIGVPVRYTATVSNLGSNATTGVSLMVTHQAQAFSSIQAQSQDASCQVVGDEVRCTTGQLAPGQSTRINITVTPQAEGVFAIAARVSYAGDVDSANDHASGWLPVLVDAGACDCACTNLPPSVLDARLTSWFTKNSGQYARAVLRTGGAEQTKWHEDSNSDPDFEIDSVYADVQRIDYTGGFVYVTSYGLASHIMGPWYCNPTTGNLFDNWPLAKTNVMMIPRTFDVSACDDTPLGTIGAWVNGTAIYNFLDAWYFNGTPDAGQDVRPPGVPAGPGVWNRNAYWSEKITFDPALFHSADHQYHSHAGPELLRVQRSDNQWPIYGPNNEVLGYVEQPSSNLWQHSPILGWAFDGHPIYGPYGYSDPMDPNSGIRRMRSGYVLRNGENGTADLSAKDGVTGRTSLPLWAELLSSHRQIDPLAASPAYGPLTSRIDTNTACNPIEWNLGRYVEDYGYLGHLLKPGALPFAYHKLGSDFDLDLRNGRCCKTPEFPDGIYAYFVTIDEEGEPEFPYITGWQFCGKMRGAQTNTASVPETATVYFSALSPKVAPPGLPSPDGSIVLQWNSRQGGQYRVLTSENLQTWTEVSPLLPSAGTTTTYTYDPGPNPPPKQFFKVTLERDNGAQQ